MHPDWARSMREQCAAAGVPYFFKRWGEWKPWEYADGDCSQYRCEYQQKNTGEYARHKKLMIRVGKKAAGRNLDGRTHDWLPWEVAE